MKYEIELDEVELIVLLRLIDSHSDFDLYEHCFTLPEVSTLEYVEEKLQSYKEVTK